MKSPLSKRLNKVFAHPHTYEITLLFLFFMLMVGKALWMSFSGFSISMEMLETVKIFSSYFISDFFIFALLIGITFLSSLCKKARMENFFLLIIFGVFLLYGIDIVVFFIFHTSVPVIEMGKFLHSSSSDFTTLIVQLSTFFLVSFLLSVFLASRKFFKTFQATLLVFPLLLLAFSVSFCFSSGGFSELPANIIEMNIKSRNSQLPPGENTSIGHSSYEEFFIPEQGENQQPNIIILFAESLSPIDSLKVGGVQDNLPYFDSITSDGMTFTNYINNGCTSDSAHIALLRGVEPLDVASYTGFYTYLESLPAFLDASAYDTTFLSTVPLTFLQQREFLKSMQFDHIIGEEAFTGQKHYVFDAAPDEDLYEKALEVLGEKNEKAEPYALIMQNISFHKPYNTPYGNTQEQALRYTDESLGRFYKRLQLSHFFDTGILIIISDHRKMEGQDKGEKEALGEFRYARGLATVVGTGITPNSTNDSIIQPTDFYHGIKKLVATGEVLVSEIANDPFSATQWRDWAFLRCAFFSTNQYSLIQANGTGRYANTIRELYSYKPAQNYLSLYLDYQYPSITKLATDPERFIAHAGGEIEGIKYTNSLEALDLSYQQGVKLFELDLMETSDGKIVATHGWKNDTPLSYEAFLAQPLEGKFTPLDMERINQRFAQHPDAILVTDKINTPQAIAQQFQFPDRVMMELFSWDAIQQAIQLGIQPMISENLIFSTPDIEERISDFTNFTNVYLVFSREQIAEHTALLQRLAAQGAKSYAFLYPYETGKDERWLQTYGKGILYGIYADDITSI